MRVAAAALWSPDPAEVFRVAAEIAALTHGHPTGYLSAGAFALMLRQVLDGAAIPNAAEAAVGHLRPMDGGAETVSGAKE